ncbi:putative addiction module antidote protein [Zymomonas mobilis]|uniref:hypothetical protein n=1 Tax=Zymomonas mobilis TaxID=542 RepID=UPI00026D81F3|nr:hypothetical protein [Zymomonas mobilis]AFN57576.1 hypothetical protein ZZ6_1721 [Zymomonas mobilis subsp. mobilis ATCC 29191]TQK74407.1 putative addiction module antidote protein [Zymomonas mobilis]TQL14657.1 putative addiction module antidote protein [Zymomonas mobilis]GEB88359.1 hypothetical protein ZMO01_16990 [Zymomonas mobilis subsp. mobilis]
MKKKKPKKLKVIPFKPAMYLSSKEGICLYLQEVINDGSENIGECLEAAMAALNILNIAQKTGLSQKEISHIFYRNKQPSVSSVSKILHALDLKLTVVSKDTR